MSRIDPAGASSRGREGEPSNSRSRAEHGCWTHLSYHRPQNRHIYHRSSTSHPPTEDYKTDALQTWWHGMSHHAAAAAIKARGSEPREFRSKPSAVIRNPERLKGAQAPSVIKDPCFKLLFYGFSFHFANTRLLPQNASVVSLMLSPCSVFRRWVLEPAYKLPLDSKHARWRVLHFGSYTDSEARANSQRGQEELIAAVASEWCGSVTSTSAFAWIDIILRAGPYQIIWDASAHTHPSTLMMS